MSLKTNWPALQSPQKVRSADDNFPSSHLVQRVEPCWFVKNPTAQVAHSAGQGGSLTLAYFPMPQS